MSSDGAGQDLASFDSSDSRDGGENHYDLDDAFIDDGTLGAADAAPASALSQERTTEHAECLQMARSFSGHGYRHTDSDLSNDLSATGDSDASSSATTNPPACNSRRRVLKRRRSSRSDTPSSGGDAAPSPSGHHSPRTHRPTRRRARRAVHSDSSSDPEPSSNRSTHHAAASSAKREPSASCSTCGARDPPNFSTCTSCDAVVCHSALCRAHFDAPDAAFATEVVCSACWPWNSQNDAAQSDDASCPAQDARDDHRNGAHARAHSKSLPVSVVHPATKPTAAPRATTTSVAPTLDAGVPQSSAWATRVHAAAAAWGGGWQRGIKHVNVEARTPAILQPYTDALFRLLDFDAFGPGVQSHAPAAFRLERWQVVDTLNLLSRAEQNGDDALGCARHAAVQAAFSTSVRVHVQAVHDQARLAAETGACTAAAALAALARLVLTVYDDGATAAAVDAAVVRAQTTVTAVDAQPPASAVAQHAPTPPANLRLQFAPPSTSSAPPTPLPVGPVFRTLPHTSPNLPECIAFAFPHATHAELQHHSDILQRERAATTGRRARLRRFAHGRPTQHPAFHHHAHPAVRCDCSSVATPSPTCPHPCHLAHVNRRTDLYAALVAAGIPTDRGRRRVPLDECLQNLSNHLQDPERSVAHWHAVQSHHEEHVSGVRRHVGASSSPKKTAAVRKNAASSTPKKTGAARNNGGAPRQQASIPWDKCAPRCRRDLSPEPKPGLETDPASDACDPDVSRHDATEHAGEH